ncbi:MAG: isochorismate synthase [Angustibacter sp.]
MASALVVRTRTLSHPMPLLAALPAGPVLSWVRRGEGLVGWGEAARWEFNGPERFAAANEWWRGQLSRAEVYDELGIPGTGPVAFGSFCFAENSSRGSSLIVPEVVLGHRNGQWWVTSVTRPGGSSGWDPVDPEPVRAPGRVRFDRESSSQAWQDMIRAAVGRIGAGAVDKVVLARALTAHTENEVDARWLLARLAEQYPQCWSFSVAGLVGATPELLLRSERGSIHSRVLAGTIARTGDFARDSALAETLAHSAKDLAEHEYAVRSLSQSLAPYCRSIDVPQSPNILQLANVMHLATDVSGVLRGADAPSVLELVAALHPTAAVGGTPTPAAVGLIAELEDLDRGRYAGPVGWIDGNLHGEWGIALRCAEIDPGDPRRLRLLAGCGIVAGSDPSNEEAEAEAKLIPMRQALGAQWPHA